MPHEWKDFISATQMEEIIKDPLFMAYSAGFRKAREIFSHHTRMARVTNEFDHFLWWKESQEKPDANT